MSDEITPLTSFKPGHYASGLLRSYPDGPGRHDRIVGDELLLARLSIACAQNRAPTVGALGDGILEEVIAAVEHLQHPRWSLAGDDSLPIRDRLNAHFMPLQKQRRSDDAERAQERARRAADWRSDPWDPVANGRRDAQVWGLPV